MSSSRGTATRRSNACWTCKLRRKKCDETQPRCAACASRKITCHGYNHERPEWMNEAASEKAELERIQRAVKENKRRQRRLLLQSQANARRDSSSLSTGCPPGDEPISFDDTPAPFSDAMTRSSVHTINQGLDTLDGPPKKHQNRQDVPPGLTSPVAHSSQPSPAAAFANVLIATPDTGGSLADSTTAQAETSHFCFSHHREAELLMHYLDVVFHLQFRFHVPSIASGGRGWLLWLLTETKPLYHAALSLGALHQHSLLSREVRDQRYRDTFEELHDHHSRAIKELAIFMQKGYDASSAANQGRIWNLKILACGVQLISFQLFQGGTNHWQTHLTSLARWMHAIAQDSNSSSNPYLTAEANPSEMRNGCCSGELENTAEKYLTGAILWFDIVAGASTGKAPLMGHLHDSLLRGCNIDLSNIMGCSNWVALLISDVSALQERKDDATRRDALNMWELFGDGEKIRQQLSNGIAELRAENEAEVARHGITGIVLDGIKHGRAVKRGVTLVFACATQVYLNATVMGADPSRNEIKTTVVETVEALQSLRVMCDPQAPRSLVWPICIAGSMAEDPSLQEYFRMLIAGLGDQAHDFGNSMTVLRIIETCWAQRQSQTPGNEPREFSWRTAMEAKGERVLLV